MKSIWAAASMSNWWGWNAKPKSTPRRQDRPPAWLLRAPTPHTASCSAGAELEPRPKGNNQRRVGRALTPSQSPPPAAVASHQQSLMRAPFRPARRDDHEPIPGRKELRGQHPRAPVRGGSAGMDPVTAAASLGPAAGARAAPRATLSTHSPTAPIRREQAPTHHVPNL